MRKQVKGAGRETEKEAAEAEEKSYERGTGEEKEGKRRRIEEADEGEGVATRNNCGERSGRREEESTLEAEKTGHESETRELGRRAEAGGTGQEREGGLQHDGAVFSSPAYLYEDAYFGGQNDYYAVDSFFDDWVEDDATQVYCGNAVLHKGTDGAANSEGKERDGCSLCGDEETDTAKAQERGDVEKRGEAASVNSMTAPTGRTHEKTSLLEKNSQPPKRRLHKQQQQEQRKGEQKQAPQQEQEEGHEQGQEHHEVKKAVGEEEHLQAQHCSRQGQQSLRRQHGKNLSGTAEERLKRQQQRLEARKKRHGDREYERREKKKVQQQEQQIRIYFAGAEATVVFALKKLLQQPQFLSLSEIVVVFCEVARQQPEHEIDATEAVFCPTPTKTLDIVHGTRSQISISPALLSEEFATVSALTRLCPAALCIVRMPCPIQNYLQQLQIKTLQTQQLSTQQNLVAQPQPEQLLIQPYVSIQGKTVGKHGSEVTQQQSVHSPFACSSSNDTARSSSCCSTSREDAGIDGSSTEKSNRPLGLYTHFLVLPLFTETTRLRSLEAYSRCVSSTSSSCIVPTGSGTAQSAIKQRQDEHFLAGDTCFVRRLTCTKALVNNQSDGNTAHDNASDSHLGAAGGCSSHENYCRKRTTTSSPLSEEVEYRPTFHSLPRQLNNLLRELRGAGRVVCIFQGVRASLAVPQPRVDDDAEVERTERDGAPSSLITLSQRGHTDNRCCSCQCIPASGEVACSCESSSVAAYIDFECSSPTQYGSPAAQKDADSRGTETGQGSSRSNTIETLSAGRWRSTSVASEKVVAESTREGARSRNGRIQTLDSEVGQDSSCLRENEKFSAEGRPILSPGELDETIATLLVDCGVDCVEPPDATSTADYILTAVKHMRAAQRAVGEQHVRMKKSKTFTAAEEAILAEVAQAATSTIADYAFLYHPHVSTATQGGPRVRCPEAAAASRPASCDVATGAHARSQIAAPVPATAMVPSGVAALAAMATGETPEGAPAGDVVALRGSRSTAVGREGTCEDVFTAYKDVFSFACRLWGKQLVQIPTVTEKVAAALMRQYKRPAALLQKIHVAEADKRRAGAPVPDEEAKFVSEANASSRSHWTGRRKGARMSAANDGHRAPGRLLVQTQLLPLQNAKKVQNVAQDKAGMRRNRIEKKKQTDQAVERVVGELADIVLHGLQADGFHAKSAGTEEDFAEAVEDIRAYKAAGKVAKIGTARARKIYFLFAEDASGIP